MLAKRSPQMGFTSLAYLMDIDWLREAFYRTRKNGAPGVDGQTWAEYAEHLEEHLQSLLDRAKSGTYRAPPVRRVHIPKGGSNTETRPIGIPNVFLHYVLDAWFETEVKPRLRGRAYLIRYADDFVIGFTREDDARRVMDVLPKRFGKYGLAIHPDKTRLVRFQRPSRATTGKEDDGPRGPETFQLLGFTHYWARSRKGRWVVKRKTASKRLSRAVRSIADWCRRNRHRPVCQQHHTLSQKVRGHYAYYGITANGRSLANFLDAVKRCWRKWLNRRDRQRTMDWDKFNRLLKRYPLPPVRIVHSAYLHAANP